MHEEVVHGFLILGLNAVHIAFPLVFVVKSVRCY